MTTNNTIPPFRIVDCTLREGEQFALAAFTSEERLSIARELDAFGVDVIEMTSPVASPRAAKDLRAIVAMGFRAEIATHVRCVQSDVEAALECGVDAVHLLLGTSPTLRTHSHGRNLDQILELARDVLPPLVASNTTVRFSCEDAFRTPTRDVLRIAQVIEDLGADRIGIADTIGCATPDEVSRRVELLRGAVDCDIEFHGHNDGDCAVANAWAAWRAGATHLDVTVLGIGERNGIASLSGLIARAAQSTPEHIERFDLTRLAPLDRQVAKAVGVEVPFNACITSPTAFMHKAGLHTKAVLAEPSCYESIDPARFGQSRTVLVGHSLVGRHAVQERARALGLELDATQLRNATTALKALADSGEIPPHTIDELLHQHASSPLNSESQCPL